MKNLSIIYDSGCLWSIKNASGIHISEIIDNLARDHNILLFAPKEKDCKLGKTKFYVQYIPTFGRGIIRFICYEMLLFVYLFFYFIKLKHDIIYARSNVGIASILISLLFGIPRVVEVNGLITEETNMREKSNKSLYYVKTLERINYLLSNKIVVVSDGIKERLKGLYNIPEKKFVVIENGANTDLFKPIDRTKCLKDLHLDKDFKYICFTGNIAPWQGLEYLIMALPIILQERPDTKVLIVGEGRLKTKLRKLALEKGVEDKIIFTGRVPYHEVPKYINASIICTDTFINSRSPVKVYEYLACEKPVVASDFPSTKFLKDENAGILVPAKDIQQLAEAILKLLKEEKLRRTMGRNGRKYVVRHRSWKSVAREVEKVILDTVNVKCLLYN